jgi:hypothetical protein
VTAQAETPKQDAAGRDAATAEMTAATPARRTRAARPSPAPLEPPAPSPAVAGRLVPIIAVAVMAIYVAALYLMFRYRADANWDRMVYLVTGYEAIVFVAVGALFGTTVHRASVHAAQTQERQARADARSERERADAAVSRGERGAALVAGVRALRESRPKSQTRPAPPRGNGERSGMRGGDPAAQGAAGAGPGDTGLDFLIQLCDELFPEDG